MTLPRPPLLPPILRSLVLLAATCPAAAQGAVPVSTLIGTPTLVTTRWQDTLLDIAREYDVGFDAIRLANPQVDPWLPGEDTTVTVPTQHLAPPGSWRGIVINLPELRLYYFPADGGAVASVPIGIGDEGKATPTGATHVARKTEHPTWTPTASEHEEDPDLPAVIGPGPDNPMGDYALYLAWPGYAIHGSNKPWSIGRRDSHGCIRLYPEDIQRLYAMVPVGTTVTVIDQTVKTAWVGDTLYLEIHPPQSDANVIELYGQPISPPEFDADQAVRAAAGDEAGLVDWDAVMVAELQRNGMPVPVAVRPPAVQPPERAP